jgi:hypothetical protein
LFFACALFLSVDKRNLPGDNCLQVLNFIEHKTQAM